MKNCSRRGRQFREDFKVISLQFPTVLMDDKKRNLNGDKTGETKRLKIKELLGMESTEVKS